MVSQRRGRRNDGNTMVPNAPSRTTLGWSPFHTAAEDYYRAGYLPIPLPMGKKYPPPKGVPNDIDYTRATLDVWLADTRLWNIGSIVPDGVAVFDVDGPAGIEALTELENKYGRLPKTWMSFRGDPERFHLWFTVPNGLVWPGKLGAGVDVIYRHYRYMVMPPSVHPNGSQYRWASLRKNNLLSPSNVYFPAPDELQDLPEAWLELAHGSGYVRRDRANVDCRLWINEHGQGEICPEMKRVGLTHVRLMRKHADLGGLHDAMVNAVWSVLAEISQGHKGGYAALRKLRNTFIAQADESGRREPGAPEAEWSRACIGAIEKTAIERVREGDPCVIEESERGRDPNRFFDPKYGLRARKLRASVERTGKLAVGPGKLIYRHVDGLWTPDGESEIYRRTERLLRERYRPSHASNVLSVVCNREPFITDDKQDTQYLNLPNGLLDWQEGKLYPHNPHVVTTVRIPIPWDEDADCPEVDQFFSEVFPADAIELAYEILGYMLYNDNPLHKAILLYGSGRNGKGTFIRLARMLVGHNNISAVTPQALDSSQFASAQLYGKLANLVGDVDPRIFKSTEQFKQLTGGDYMMGQHKHRDPFVFRCRALMIAAFNSLPRTADTTEGFFSRWVVIPFTAFFPAGKADPTLIERLTRVRVLQGLLRASVGGLQSVMRRGAFDIPPSVASATERFKMEADPLRGFIEERVVSSHPSNPSYVPRTQIYDAYSAWASTNGFHQMSAQRFYEQFTAAAVDTLVNPFAQVVRDGVKVFKGIELR
jgi:putative DNA primase/helicase